ncbi:hypothetical protein SAMN05216452_3201 [Nitratireductor aquibiodomus]|uniref:Uncharacterized protein n=1 Tax=Nitratireductor aquibiodomus TaxID=204799 RepID=A0A1H4MAN2_9HYPH|nr:hypothetical protein [Nitratireductor aquibiodomus]SEB79422.1 hypothetical protein SAMN05216452_3201 [Nitratireductor aquibiodomus]
MMNVIKGFGAGLIVVVCLLVIRFVWGVQFDVQRVFYFMLGLAPIAFGISAICYIALMFVGKDE